MPGPLDRISRETSVDFLAATQQSNPEANNYKRVWFCRRQGALPLVDTVMYRRESGGFVK